LTESLVVEGLVVLGHAIREERHRGTAAPIEAATASRISQTGLVHNRLRGSQVVIDGIFRKITLTFLVSSSLLERLR